MAGAVLSAHELEEIRVGLEAAESFTDIARRLHRTPSPVSQEVRRNGGRLRYCAAEASVRAAENRCRSRPTKFQRNRPLTDHVEARLVALDSPTTIAVELARAGGIGGDTVSAETIYQGVSGPGGWPPGWGPNSTARGVAGSAAVEWAKSQPGPGR
jgi:IS30 family transposase